MAYNTVILEKREGIATITLNRPQAMNALSRQLIKIIYYMLKNRECYQRERVVH